MTLCHVKRKNSFVVIDKKIVMDKNLSWKAKGILLYAFSRPEDWSFYKQEMISHSSDGEKSFDSGIKELEKYGYLHRKVIQDEKKRLNGWEWFFYEEPISKDEFKKSFRNPHFVVDGVLSSTPKRSPTNKDIYTKTEKNTNTETTTSSFSVKEPPDPKPESVVLSGCAGSAVADGEKNFDVSFEVNMCDGTKKTVDPSQVYRHFSSKRFEGSGIETWMIQEGLKQMRERPRQYRNVMLYLEHLCKAKIRNKKNSTQSSKHAKPKEIKMSIEEQRALVAERRRQNRLMWEEAEKEMKNK